MTWIENDHLGDCSPEKNCCWRLKFRHPFQSSLKMASHILSKRVHIVQTLCGSHLQLSLKMASAHIVETSVVNNGSSQDSSHPDDHFQSRYVTPGFKPLSYLP